MLSHNKQIVSEPRKFDQILHLLREKWAVVPTSLSGRCDLSKLEDYSDTELLQKWETVRSEATTGSQYSHRGWYHTLYAPILQNKNVLDIGSGFGIDGITFAQHGAQVTFVDIVEQNLLIIERICKILGITNINTILLKNENSLKSLGYDCDAILAMGSLHHAPSEFIKIECHELLQHLRIGGRWLQLAYPKSRWVRDGMPPFDQWGVITDGENTPWAEWYSLSKLLELLEPFAFDVVLSQEFHNNKFVWFDLIFKGKKYQNEVIVQSENDIYASNPNDEDYSFESKALWNHRHTIARSRPRIEMLAETIGHSSLLLPYQWAQLIAFAIEFHPDLILEIGRGCGNSTCAFLEASHQLGPKNCRILSLCSSDLWEIETLPKIKKVLPANWFDPLTAVRSDILSFNYIEYLNQADRILVFWSEHGFDVAECILGTILPIIKDRPHTVIMHGITDSRFQEDLAYDKHGLWKGNNQSGVLKIGFLGSRQEQVVAILDFIGRNRIQFHSAEFSFRKDFGHDVDKMTELQAITGRDLFSLEAHWFWFSLYGISTPLYFP